MILLYHGSDLERLEQRLLSFQCYPLHQISILEEKGPPSDLIARTGGVITRFALKEVNV